MAKFFINTPTYRIPVEANCLTVTDFTEKLVIEGAVKAHLFETLNDADNSTVELMSDWDEKNLSKNGATVHQIEV